ncbi:hypothetical protein OsJ_10441 [Oryza sativa Japonica Group]|uniref:Rhodanese domain-containing protein n=1 Tax=Oryza sativa subsp. japonica TaxID=39947 RepID=B9F7R5_ORYSJ|nr:hypothetical protein OsJ_10441 [Oryza sativa Japonica Group]
MAMGAAAAPWYGAIGGGGSRRARVRAQAAAPWAGGAEDLVRSGAKWVHFGYIGLWTGQSFTKMNDRFLDDVAAAAGEGKDAKLLVACGEGLRSLIAVRMLYDDGYKNLAWLAGGFSKCVDGDFADVEGESKLQYATVGGVSYIFLQILLLLRVVK